MRLFKQTALALLLLALSVTSFASPEGWERLNGMERSVGTEANAEAKDRGAEFYLNLEALRLEMYPWSDGSGDVLTMRPVFPAGTSVVFPEGGTVRDGLTEVAHGWRADLVGGDLDGVVLRLMDLQGDKVPEALDDFLAPGLALIYTFPVESVPLSGEWNAKRIRFGGIVEDCNFYVQPPLTQQQIDDGHRQPEWVPGSIAIYHATKRNDRGFRKHGTGKFAHLPRPLMVGRNASGITGYAFGDYVEVSHGVFDKVFDMGAILANPSQTLTKFGIGQPTQVHISADLGYTTGGGSVDSSVANVLYTLGDAPNSAGWPIGEDGEVDSIFFDFGADVSATGTRVGIYQDATATTADLVGNSEVQKAADGMVQDGANYWHRYDYSTKPALVSGEKYKFSYVSTDTTFDIRYDASAGQAVWRKTSQTPATAFPDPLSSSAELATLQASAYVSYSVAATTPVTTNTTVTPSSQVKGVDVALSADINTASETISDAEYFIGVDPGEGSGTTMSLGAGTTSREATATIDTSAITSGAHTVSVRGYDAVNGWGAVDTDTLTVTLPIITGLTATPGDTVVNLTWDDFAGSASGTRIIWDTVSPPVANDIDTFGLAYEHTGRTNGVEYFYTVSAKDGGGVGTASDIVSAVPSEPTAIPSEHLNLGLSIGL